MSHTPTNTTDAPHPLAADLLPKLEADTLSQANWKTPGVHTTLPVLTVAQLRRVEHTAFQHVDSFLLMQAAGTRSARKIAHWIEHADQTTRQVVVLAGTGNNGGDACVVAAELAIQGMDVELWQLPTAKQASADRAKALALCESSPAIFKRWGIDPFLLEAGTVVVDGLLGIACASAPTEPLASWISTVNEQVSNIRQECPSSIRVASLDSPSGLDCSTGQAPGAAIQADLTLSYIACKTGLLTDAGKDLCGELLIDSLGCDALLAHLQTSGELGPVAAALGKRQQLKRLPHRAHAHHKGSFGSLGVLGGQAGMVGACVLSARAALLMGTGRVALSLLKENQSQGVFGQFPDLQVPGADTFLDLLFPEVMNKPLGENLNFADVLVVGPGLGQTEQAQDFLFQVLASPKGHDMVWDADALNLLAQSEEHGHIDPEQPLLEIALQQYRAQYPDHALVFTPHPLEAARLLNWSTVEVQSKRTKAALSISERFDCTVVLKGAGTVIANKTRGLLEINTTGGPALATAGSGDVLAGAIGAMLGQGLGEFEAAALAVWLHGLSIEPVAPNEQKQMISHASDIATRMKMHLNTELNGAIRLG